MARAAPSLAMRHFCLLFLTTLQCHASVPNEENSIWIFDKFLKAASAFNPYVDGCFNQADISARFRYNETVDANGNVQLAYLATGKDQIHLSFSGSIGLSQVCQNANMATKQIECVIEGRNVGLVNPYVYEVFQHWIQNTTLLADLQSLFVVSPNVAMSSYSLGASVAELFALQIIYQFGVRSLEMVEFGPPATGNSEFAEKLHAKVPLLTKYRFESDGIVEVFNGSYCGADYTNGPFRLYQISNFTDPIDFNVTNCGYSDDVDNPACLHNCYSLKDHVGYLSPGGNVQQFGQEGCKWSLADPHLGASSRRSPLQDANPKPSLYPSDCNAAFRCTPAKLCSLLG